MAGLGAFISLDGVDGGGKTGAIAALQERLVRNDLQDREMQEIGTETHSPHQRRRAVEKQSGPASGEGKDEDHQAEAYEDESRWQRDA